jgi:hypothetical protein
MVIGISYYKQNLIHYRLCAKDAIFQRIFDINQLRPCQQNNAASMGTAYNKIKDILMSETHTGEAY